MYEDMTNHLPPASQYVPRKTELSETDEKLKMLQRFPSVGRTLVPTDPIIQFHQQGSDVFKTSKKFSYTKKGRLLDNMSETAYFTRDNKSRAATRQQVQRTDFVKWVGGCGSKDKQRGKGFKNIPER